MAATLRDTVIGALDLSTGVLNTPDFARPILGGQDFDLDLLEMDSLTVMEFIMHLESDLHIDIEVGDIAPHTSLNSLVTYLQSRTHAPG